MNKIELKHVSKHYPTFSLKDVSFAVPEGYVTGFIGRNGMGKTTTLKAILNILHYEGEIIKRSSKDGKPFNNQNVGVIMDDSFLAKDWSMSLVNNAMRVGYNAWDETLFYFYLEQFDIDRRLKVKELSRGMKIKLMLAIALSHQAELLILDEPTSGLDPSMREELMELLSEYMQEEGRSILFSTHITQDLEVLADYIVLLDQGEVVLAKEKEAFLNFFQLVKGDVDQLNLLDDAWILGKKVSKYQVECLLKREAVDKLPNAFIEDQLTIDRIMVLYGRER